MSGSGNIVGRLMICQRCGGKTPCRNGNQRYCPECKAIIVHEQNVSGGQRRRARLADAALIGGNGKMTIGQVNALAREQGMTYGKFVAQEMSKMEEEMINAVVEKDGGECGG